MHFDTQTAKPTHQKSSFISYLGKVVISSALQFYEEILWKILVLVKTFVIILKNLNILLNSNFNHLILKMSIFSENYLNKKLLQSFAIMQDCCCCCIHMKFKNIDNLHIRKKICIYSTKIFHFRAVDCLKIIHNEPKVVLIWMMYL